MPEQALYKTIRDDLLRAIENGTLLPDQALPSERELCQRYGTSRMTVRHAVTELETLGSVYRVQGKGTFVSQSKLVQPLMQVSGFTEDMAKRGKAASSQILFAGTKRADAAIAKLGVDEIPLQTLFALNTRAAKGEILWRFSWPLAALNLVLLAIPLSYTNPRAGRSLSLVIAVLIFVLYLNGISIGQTWVRGGKMEWYTGVILINGSVFFITAMLFIRRVWMTRWLPLAWTEWPYRLREARKEREK